MKSPEYDDKVTEERRLRLALESLRDAYSEEQASPSTEEQLLLSFREINSGGRRPKRAWLHWTLAAAAVLLVCVFGLWLASRATPEPQPRQQAVTEPVRAGSARAEGRSDRIGSLPEAQTTRPARIHRLRKTADSAATGHARHASDSDNADADAFIPTMFPLGSDADYGLQLVRVELPRRAMMSFGLPVDSRDMNRPVKADLIIGPDGLTRAIRFVQ